MSGFVPGFESDLFVSYAHADDPTWIQAFERSLADELRHRLGLGVSVWQDTKRLRVGQNWQVEVEAGVKGAAAFVAVLSPSYENSDWCTRERTEALVMIRVRGSCRNAMISGVNS